MLEECQLGQHIYEEAAVTVAAGTPACRQCAAMYESMLDHTDCTTCETDREEGTLTIHYAQHS